MKIHCINCGKDLEVSETDAGRSVYCGACGKDFTSPLNADASAESFDPKHPDGYRKKSTFGVIAVTVIVSTLIVVAFIVLFYQLNYDYQPTLTQKDGRYELSLGYWKTLELLPVEAGTFTMGSNESEALKYETPHTVTLTKDYWIGKYEVTQEQYESVMGTNPSRFKNGGKYPVEEVSWDDAQEFCKKLNRQLSTQLPVGYEFRLPTEAEWEYAARGGKKSKGYKYSGSDKIATVAWYWDNSQKETHPVGGKQPNELGLYDMSGNVWERCLDCCNGSMSKGVQTDTYRDNVTDPLCTMGSYRVSRGGGWSNGAGGCCVSRRFYWGPSIGNDDLGFRLALAPKIVEHRESKTLQPQPLAEEKPQPLKQMTLTTKGDRYELALSEEVVLELLPVEAGTFTMGSSDSDAWKDETPHKVTLTKDYWLGKYEVTQEQYSAVMGTNPSNFKKDAKYPVEKVSWNDAQEFCKKLNDMLSSQLPRRYEFRLPTEAEWEYAARGGKKSKGYKYSGSNDIGSVAWYRDNSPETHPVGGKQPNELGLYDMSGNVWELCLDSCNLNSISYTVETDTYRNNIQDPLCTTGSFRVFRGGSWNYRARRCRVSSRGYGDPSISSNDLGFRLALAPCR